MCVYQSEAVRAMLPSAVFVSVSTRVCAVLLWHCIRRAQQSINALKNSSRQVFLRPFKPAPCFTVSSTNLPLM